jgi:hypothetical protein
MKWKEIVKEDDGIAKTWRVQDVNDPKDTSARKHNLDELTADCEEAADKAEQLLDDYANMAITERSAIERVLPLLTECAKILNAVDVE